MLSKQAKIRLGFFGGDMRDFWACVRHVGRAITALVFVGWLASTVAHAAEAIPEFTDPGPGAPVHVDADSLSYDRNGTTVIARGNVVITYGDYLLKADHVTYNPETNQIVAVGNVVLTEPDGAVLNAHRMELGDRFREGFVDRVAVVLVNNARINALRGRRTGGNVSTFEKVTYTACEPCKEDPSRPVTWEIKADRITHNQAERTIEYENAEFDFLGTPIAYLPYFSHADPTVKRQSGFLIPTMSVSEEFGAGVEIPYFLNLAPNYDLTLSPLLTTKQGPVMKAQWRHRLANGRYSVTPTGVYELSKKSATPGDSRFRGSIESRGDFRLGRDWTWGWDGTFVSDDTYMRRYNIDGRTDLISQLYLTGLNDRNYFDARAYHFRGLLSTDSNKSTPYVLPVIDHSYYFHNPVLGGELKLDSNFLQLTRDRGVDETRLVSEMKWERRMVSSVGTVVTPFAYARGDLYAVDNVPDPSIPSGVRNSETVARFLPSAGVDVRWPFVNLSASGQHILEPVAQVIVRPNEIKRGKLPNEDAVSFEFDDTNLFSYNKFSGYDRWEGGTRANAGLIYTYRFSGDRYLKAAFGQSYHLAGRNSHGADSGLESDDSDYVGALFLQINENLLLTSRFRLDEDKFDIQRNEFGLDYNRGPLQMSVNYSDLDKAPAFGRPSNQEEIWGQGALRLSEEWTVYAGMRYNVELDKRISDFIGFGYENECFGLRIHYREAFVKDRDIDPDRSVSLRFELKTIGSAGFSSGIN